MILYAATSNAGKLRDFATAAAVHGIEVAPLPGLANGRAPEAVSGFRAAIEARPDFLDARHGLVLALDAAGQIDEGIAAALQLIADEPDDVLAYTSLSILYQHAGKVPEAEAASAKAKILGWKHELRAGKP